MRPAWRRAAALGTAIVVVAMGLTVLLARASLGIVPPLQQFTPTALVYAPVVFRDHDFPTATVTVTPTNTATPTSTPTPIPTHARFYLCCSNLSETCGCGAAEWTLGTGQSFPWESGGLPMDIAGTTYEFAIAASSVGSTVFEVELHLIQQAQDLLLASTSFTVASAQPARYVQGVQGIDPAVTIDQDRLQLIITNVSGARVTIYNGNPDTAEAGGSYVQFPRSP